MRIVCAGDSLTRGVTFTQGRLRIVRENYPRLLHEWLGSSDDIEIMNKGVFADNSDLLLDRFGKDVLELEPDIVIIQVGANDCDFPWSQVANRPDEVYEPQVPLSRYAENIRTLVSSVRDVGAIPIMISILPLDPVRYYRHLLNQFGKEIAHWICTVGGIEPWHANYNRELEKVMSELSVDTINIRTHFKNTRDEFLSSDGVHLTVSGYAHFSRVILDYLRLWFPRLSG